MRADAPSAPVPTLLTAACMSCRGLTAATIRGESDRYACPRCVPAVVPGPVPYELEPDALEFAER